MALTVAMVVAGIAGISIHSARSDIFGPIVAAVVQVGAIVTVAVLLLSVAAIVRMAAAVGLAVRDMAQNSFRA